jgi:predicted SAM-dependent methyltransferase
LGGVAIYRFVLPDSLRCTTRKTLRLYLQEQSLSSPVRDFPGTAFRRSSRAIDRRRRHADTVAMSELKVLDLGCGANKTPGAFGIDCLPGPGVDLVHDLNTTPWPLQDSSFDRIVCAHVVEHLNNLVGVMEEIHRVGKPGAHVTIVTPHFSSLNSWEDPTHVRHFARRSFSFFDPESRHHYTQRRLKTVSVRLTFGSGLWDLMGRTHYALWPNLWEKHFCFTWRARNLEVELEVVKE